MHHRQLGSLRSARIHEYALAMRRSPSEPEARLFHAIRARKLGVAFRRQAVLAGYVVDFVAPAARVIVEVDGVHHERQRGADARRDRVLEGLGYRVLRLPAQLVLRDVGAAVERIRRALEPP